MKVVASLIIFIIPSQQFQERLEEEVSLLHKANTNQWHLIIQEIFKNSWWIHRLQREVKKIPRHQNLAKSVSSQDHRNFQNSWWVLHLKTMIIFQKIDKVLVI